ncbi:MAG: hypothetical protein ACOY4Q_03195 [Bacillota bacterium]
MKIALFGAGKMGACVAKCFDGDELVVYDVDKKRAADLAGKIGCKAAIRPRDLYSFPYLVLALNKKESIQTAYSALDYVNRADIIVLCTYVGEHDLPVELAEKKGCRFYPVKIIGHYLVQNVKWSLLCTKQLPAEIKARLARLGPITVDDGQKAGRINPLAAELAVRLGRRMASTLGAEGFSEEVIKSAVASVAAGTLMEFPWDNPDDFMKSIINRGDEK